MEDLEAIALAAYGRDPGRMNAEITARIGIKRCSTCRVWKRIDAFGVSRDKPDGRNNKCLDCQRDYYRDWHARPGNAAKQAGYTKALRERDPEATKEKRLRERCNRYNITTDQYREMLAAQNYGCAICGRTEEQNGRNFAIDHDHRCCPEGNRSCGECVRGLLCSPCNVAVGYFEQEDTRRACEAYVERHLGDGKA